MRKEKLLQKGIMRKFGILKYNCQNAGRAQKNIYHQYVVRCSRRDELQNYLADKGIQTQIHYPVPPHLAKCYQHLGHSKGEFPITEGYADEVLSLPIYTGMTAEEQDYVIEQINLFH